VRLRAYEAGRVSAIRKFGAGSSATGGWPGSIDTNSVFIIIISSEFHGGGSMSGDAARGGMPLQPFKARATTYAATPQYLRCFIDPSPKRHATPATVSRRHHSIL